MSAEERIAILERAVSDLQRELREFHGYAPPKDADLLDHTSVRFLNVHRLYHLNLERQGITSVERLVAFVNGDWSRLVRLPGFAPADGKMLKRAVEELNLQPDP